MEPHFLVVVQAWAEHAKGAVIRDAEAIAHALAEHAEKVVRVVAPTPAVAAPAPAPTQES